MARIRSGSGMEASFFIGVSVPQQGARGLASRVRFSGEEHVDGPAATMLWLSRCKAQDVLSQFGIGQPSRHGVPEDGLSGF